MIFFYILVKVNQVNTYLLFDIKYMVNLCEPRINLEKLFNIFLVHIYFLIFFYKNTSFSVNCRLIEFKKKID